MFGKKKEEEPQPGGAVEEISESGAEEKKDEVSSAELSLPQIGAELDKLKAQFSSYHEMQSAANERFTRVS